MIPVYLNVGSWYPHRTIKSRVQGFAFGFAPVEIKEIANSVYHKNITLKSTRDKYKSTLIFIAPKKESIAIRRNIFPAIQELMRCISFLAELRFSESAQKQRYYGVDRNK